MEHLRLVAYQSVGRACGFAGLAIFCLLVGLSFEPLTAARTGGVLTLLMTAVLLIKARHARTQDYRRTEWWLMLDRNQRPPAAYAQWAAATVLRDAYLRFAHYTAGISVLFWTIATFLTLFAISGGT